MYQRSLSQEQVLTNYTFSIAAGQNTTCLIAKPCSKFSDLARHPEEVDAPPACVKCRKDYGEDDSPLACDKVRFENLPFVS